MRGVKRSALAGALGVLCACAPTRPPVDDGCAETPFPEDLPVLAYCEWPSLFPIPTSPALVREGPHAPGTLALCRPPFGEYDDRVVQIARSIGLRTVEYDLPSGDPGAPTNKLVEWVLEKAQPGSIVVMHLNHVRFHTADALPEIIAGLRARGFTFVKVSDLAGGGAPAAVASASAVP